MSEIDPDLLRGYIAYLDRGATTHAAYAQTASVQAVELSAAVDAMASNQTVDIESGMERGDSDVQIAASRVELLNLQASIHTLGLSTCLLGLALLAGQGHSVPQAPRLPEEPPT